MTAAEKLRHRLVSGPVKSELRTLKEAIQIAAAFYRQAKEEMRLTKGLDLEKGFAVHIAYLTPDLYSLFTRRYVPGREAEIYNDLSSECCIMAGLVFGILDPEHDGEWLIGAKPFLTTPLVLGALKERMSSDVIGVS